jgi:hypothetical protein
LERRKGVSSWNTLKLSTFLNPKIVNGMPVKKIGVMPVRQAGFMAEGGSFGWIFAIWASG